MSIQILSAAVNVDEARIENPHACIIPGHENTSCLACMLVAQLGEDRRDEAVDLAASLGRSYGEKTTTAMTPETITVSGTTIELLRKLHGEEVLKGMTTFCGIPCHVYFIRVH